MLTGNIKMTSKRKTVYVLGAGFSKGGGAPPQNDILRKIGELSKDDIKDNLLLRNWDKYERSKLTFFKFLRRVFQRRTNKELFEIELEDVFTLLDKAILKHHHVNKYSEMQLLSQRRMLDFCLTFMFDAKVRKPYNKFYIDLANGIVRERLNRSKQDLFSFINLNWDVLLDNCIYTASIAQNKKNIPEKRVSIDYCFYTDSFNKSDSFFKGRKHEPHIRLKAMDYKNIKVLKPHGSFNWLVCMNCGKVLIDLRHSIAKYEYIEKQNCTYCNKPALKAVIKTPSLIKEFDNVHLSDVLHNIEIELLEASKVVFIGYSLPLADIELRYIFKRCIDVETEVEVVLIKDEKDPGDYESTMERYKRLFGRQFPYRNLKADWAGLGSENYFRYHTEFFKTNR